MADRSLKLVAIKVVGLKQPNRQTCQTFHHEIALLNRLRGHNRVINLVDFSMDNVRRKVRLAMEHRETYLNQFLNRQMGKPISSWFIKHIGEQMLEAVYAVHEMGIIHTDLKPANFILVQVLDRPPLINNPPVKNQMINYFLAWATNVNMVSCISAKKASRQRASRDLSMACLKALSAY
ncbi:hypothetical protein PCASD_22315 [Puccinia coronata f. sp. avenae]|uniref:Protein kinase domain-containing protein n=1 Tax=Puccinia coronata f. sp. avenae TaxID=200324 RepID=A0A2N5TW65_9BASI|nr:hypothetical protein PCASD_22315 [Puccinia coronata f. sp. avenae]